VSASLFAARATARQCRGGEDEQAGLRVEVAGIARVERNTVGGNDLVAARMVQRQPTRMRLRPDNHPSTLRERYSGKVIGMSDQPHAQGWWLASDGKWYPPPAPEQAPPPLWQPGPTQAVPAGSYTGYVRPQRSGVNGYAIASLLCAILGSGIGSILALVFGYRARREIIMSGNRQGGRGLATAGIILGWIGLLAVTVLIFVALAGGSHQSSNY